MIDRRLLLSVALATLAVTGGCSDSPGTITASAASVAVNEFAASDAGYEHHETTSRQLRTTVRASLQGDVAMESSRRVNATLRITRYRRATDAGPAVVAVVSAPAVYLLEEAGNVTRNPAATATTVERVNRAQTAYDVEGLSKTGRTERVTVLGNTTRLTVYAAAAAGTDLTVYLGTVRDGEDFVTVVAVHPASVEERARVLSLAGSLRH